MALLFCGMVDWIKAYIDTHDLGKIKSLRQYRHDIDEYGREWWQYGINNINIWVKEYSKGFYKVSIDGSPASFAFGQNFHQTNNLSTKLSVVRLNKKLGIDFTKFKITQLDLGVNIPVSREAKSYLQLFEYLPNYIRDDFKESNGTLYFWSKPNKQKKYSDIRFKVDRFWKIYDKVNHSEETPPLVSGIPDLHYLRNNPSDIFGSEGILRLEYSLRRDIFRALEKHLVPAWKEAGIGLREMGKQFLVKDLIDLINPLSKTENFLPQFFLQRLNEIEMKKEINKKKKLKKADLLDLLIVEGSRTLIGRDSVIDFMKSLNVEENQIVNTNRKIQEAYKNNKIWKESEGEVEIKREVKQALIRLKLNKV
ncbi:MAG: phage/plasmid replication protein [Cyclobacteriaceae bacterium]